MNYLFAIILLCFSALLQAKECVILLHGLARSADAMQVLEKRLQQAGYVVSNVDYPSTQYPIEQLAALAIEQGLRYCQQQSAQPVHFVTHSLGGILVRYYLTQQPIAHLGRVVMLGPPNQGSEVVDNLKDVPGFELLNGPAGQQLGTDEASVPRRLGPVDFELGVIAGTQSINLLLSTLLPNPDDGKVSLESTKVKGMTDFIALPTTHPFMMKNDAVIAQTLYFLQHGEFEALESK
ncbi:alpha/beta hydrolase [Rheinheimera sp. UJ51]|uniref:lipase family alpha/beta hydrolase n=1 Tax=Rheinheimera sp. UJ51 TaxID=2892446 RepID=UPI001E541165|nr:alpha/beta fold hydrolase [Rheinheimera sp. UJ51]MCC5452606.1 alpha/beta hydrolase [Rheinheimera sp. UJ51]